MPNPYDLLSEKLDDQADPDDQLRLQMGQDQGANLAGGPQPAPDGAPQMQAGIQPVPASPNVPGPLAALAPPKPRITMRRLPSKPHIKLKSKKAKPNIKLKSGY